MHIRSQHRADLEALTVRRLPLAIAIIVAFVGAALPIELYYYPDRLRIFLAVYAVEIALGLAAWAAALRWRSAARMIATIWAAALGVCICIYYPLVQGDANIALAAAICLVSTLPALLPFELRHQLTFATTCAVGFFAIVVGGVPMSIPWPYMFVAFLAVLSVSSVGVRQLARSRWETFQRETILREAHTHLRDALARAETGIELRDRLVANVSHELRTPLNVIVGYSDILLDATGDAATVADAAPRIRDYARSLEALVTELLDLSRLACGKVHLAIEDVELPTLLEELARATRVMLGDKPIEVIVDCRVDHFRSDRMRLRQILHNLTANATKFTERGTIVIRAEAEDGRIRFQVSDSGCGIPAAQQERIFTAFEQLTPSPRGVAGIGLGLAIVRQLTDLLGGSVSVVSALGLGATFTVSLPDGLLAPAAVAARYGETPAGTGRAYAS